MCEDLIYGIHVIHRLLETKPEQVLEIYVVDTREEHRLTSMLTQAKQYGISVTFVQKKQLDLWLKEANHQGIAARVRLSSLWSFADLLQELEQINNKSSSNPLLLILDGIQDPHNLGACIRTADAVGATAVIIPKDRSVGLTPTVRKIASGAAETVPVVQVTNLARCLDQLKEQSIWIMGTSANASRSLYQVDFRSPVAIVMGAEGSGLRHLTEKHCDGLMQIPMNGVIESLNVSVAAGVCLYEALRQRATFNFNSY